MVAEKGHQLWAVVLVKKAIGQLAACINKVVGHVPSQREYQRYVFCFFSNVETWNVLSEARCCSSDLLQCGLKVPCVHYASSVHNNAKHAKH